MMVELGDWVHALVIVATFFLISIIIGTPISKHRKRLSFWNLVRSVISFWIVLMVISLPIFLLFNTGDGSEFIRVLVILVAIYLVVTWMDGPPKNNKKKKKDKKRKSPKLNGYYTPAPVS